MRPRKKDFIHPNYIKIKLTLDDRAHFKSKDSFAAPTRAN